MSDTRPLPKDWPIGKPVRLATGGPTMVISQSITYDITEDPEWEGYAVECAWFDKHDLYRKAFIAPKLLVDAEVNHGQDDQG